MGWIVPFDLKKLGETARVDLTKTALRGETEVPGAVWSPLRKDRIEH